MSTRPSRIFFGLFEAGSNLLAALVGLAAPRHLAAMLAPPSALPVPEGPFVDFVVRAYCVLLVVLAVVENRIVWRGDRDAMRKLFWAMLVGDLLHLAIWSRDWIVSPGLLSMMSTALPILAFGGVRVVMLRWLGAAPPSATT